MSDEKTANFHIYLLLHLSRLLGFFPVQNHAEDNEWLDLRNAQFKSFPPASERLEPELASLLRYFMESNLQSACELSNTRIQRNKLLEALLEYYSIHLPGMGEIKSYGILKEIFE